MDKGALAVARILLLSLVLGGAVILTHPGYRAAFMAVLRGKPESSPVWMSNENYYPAVRYTESVPYDQPE